MSQGEKERANGERYAMRCPTGTRRQPSMRTSRSEGRHGSWRTCLRRRLRLRRRPTNDST